MTKQNESMAECNEAILGKYNYEEKLRAIKGLNLALELIYNDYEPGDDDLLQRQKMMVIGEIIALIKKFSALPRWKYTRHSSTSKGDDILKN